MFRRGLVQCLAAALTLDQITGDDTPALQAVLDADVWRKHLLREQEVSRAETSLLHSY